MESTGLCLFLPRRAHFAAPAPSFVEAVAGTVTDTPTRETVEQATELLKRLAADAAVVPLNLFGGAGAPGAGFGAAAVAGPTGLGSFDTPDFVAAREALPYVFSLIGGRNWKSGPGGKASPLMVELWTLLESKLSAGDGAQTAGEIQQALGREVTETAVLRTLGELWQGLRVVPVYDGPGLGADTRWELTQARFAAELTASQKVAQTTALSTLVALYLESAVAAEEDEIETFLSPLTSRSRVREVVNGLQATRQLGLVSVGAHPLLHVAGTLPEFAEAEGVSESASQRVSESASQRGDGASERVRERPRFGGAPGAGREGAAGRPERKSFVRKPFERGDKRPLGKKPFEKKPYERGEKRPYSRPQDGERKPYERKSADRGEGFAARGGERPYRPKTEGERPYRKPEERRPYGARPQSGERKPFGKKPFERKPYGARPSGGARPFDKERTGERRSFGGGGKFPPKRTGTGPAKPWQERGGDREGGREGVGGTERTGGERKSFGGEKPFGARKPFGGPRKFGAAKPGAGKSFGGPRKFGAGKPGGGKSYGRSAATGRFERGKPEEKRPFFRERPVKDGEGEPRRREFGSEKREGTDARPAKRTGGWKPKGAGFATGGKPGFKKAGKPFGKPGFKSSGKPGFKSGGKTFGKPGFKSTGKPGFKKAGKPFGKPGFKKAGPGGSKPPFRKKKEGSGDGE